MPLKALEKPLKIDPGFTAADPHNSSGLNGSA